MGVYVGVILPALRLGDGLFYLCLGGQQHLLAVGAVEHEDLVAVGDDGADMAVYVLEGYLLVHLLHQLITVGGREYRFAVEKVVYTLLDQTAVAAVALHLHAPLGCVEIDGLCPCQFVGGKSVLAHSLHLSHSRSDATQYVVLLAAYAEAEGVAGARYEEHSVAHRAAHIGRVGGLLALVCQSAVEHVDDEPLHISVALIVHGGLLCAGRRCALHVEMSQRDGLLAVFLYRHYHAVAAVYGVVDALCRVLGGGNFAKEPFDFGFHAVYIYVAHHNHRLEVGPVPLVIIVAQVLIGKIADDVHIAYRHAVLVLGAAVYLGHHALHESLHRHARAPVAPLFAYHATLLVYLLVLEQYVVAPVVEHQQTRVYDALTADGGSPYVVDGLVYRGVGIEIGSEFHTYRLAPGHYAQPFALAGEVLGTIKRHVLQKMSQTTLAGFLENAAHPLGDIEIGQSGLLGVVAYVVGESVLQLTRAHGIVLLHRLCRQRGREHEGDGQE